MKRVEDFPYWLPGSVIWSGLSFIILREFIENVTLGTTSVSGKMNFAHVQTWRAHGARNGEFRISARADYPRLFDTDFEILQNPVQKLHSNSVYLPHWPVPNLKARATNRRGVKNIGYAGRVENGNFAAELLREDPRLKGSQISVIPPYGWHDMSKIDILVAVRSFDRQTYDNKPPSKLFCSWLTRVPLIAGWDSAFSAVGRPNVDYIRVDNTDAFYSAIERLIGDELFYHRIVHAGAQHTEELQLEALAQVWLRALRGPISESFERFRARSDFSLTQTMNTSLDSMRGTLGRIKNAFSN